MWVGLLRQRHQKLLVATGSFIEEKPGVSGGNGSKILPALGRTLTTWKVI